MSDANQGPAADQEFAQTVERPGLIEVHQGDKVVAAPGSEAAVSARSGTEVHYYFPVHVVLTGDMGPEARQAIEDEIWDQLYRAFS
ncbi:hypothetical protein [Streptomyces sp. NPDC001657]|uniref:hypothetical protein n=1 Tax=unclassified Streptomyces TaxID=2593676 RepID=UPI00331B6BDD